MLHDVSQKITNNVIKLASSQRYARISIKRVDINEEGEEVQKRKMRADMIKVSGLSHKKENKSDPRLTWFMFHNIYIVYSDTKNKE